MWLGLPRQYISSSRPNLRAITGLSIPALYRSGERGRGGYGREEKGREEEEEGMVEERDERERKRAEEGRREERKEKREKRKRREPVNLDHIPTQMYKHPDPESLPLFLLDSSSFSSLSYPSPPYPPPFPHLLLSPCSPSLPHIPLLVSSLLYPHVRTYLRCQKR